MLKLRILTAVILGPLILWSVIAFSHRALAIELGLVLVIAAWEWARLAGIQNQFGRVVYSIFIASAMFALTVLLHTRNELLQPILIVVALWWLAALVIIIVFDTQQRQEQKIMTVSNIVINLVSGLIILLGAFVSIIGLHQAPQYGYVFILILLALIWLADSAAYFSGKAFGKHKLAPHISPGKTWEGVLGALIATLIAAYMVTHYLHYSGTTTVLFILIALCTVLISVVGDLLESLFKRRAGVKDSSHLLPGHGGILDRIDSLVAAAPVFLLGLMLARI